MALIRIHKTDNYTVMCNNHLREKQMSLKAMGLMSLMLSLPDNWEYSIAGLTALSKDGKDSVMSALNELEQFGYLKRSRRFDERGRFAGFDYDIYEQPQSDAPYSEKPHTEKPYSEKPYSEKPPQINTNLQSTNSKNECMNEGSKEDIKNAHARESFEGIERRYGIDDDVKNAIAEFVKALQLNGQKVTNDRLKRNLEAVITYPTTAERVAAIYQAIDSGAGVVKPKPTLHYDTFGIKSASRGERYEDIINSPVYAFGDTVKSALWDFISYRGAIGRKMTNGGLTALCEKLNRLYRPSDDNGKVKALTDAMRGGYADIKDGEGWLAQGINERRRLGLPLIGEGAE